MKKTYTTPAMLEIHINMRGIICGSYLTTSADGDNLEGTLFNENATTDALVKSNKNIWDDQW